MRFNKRIIEDKGKAIWKPPPMNFHIAYTKPLIYFTKKLLKSQINIRF